MIVYRVGRAKYARDLTGEGARLNGGRWNSKGVSCIYTSSTRALAVLEYSVNVRIENIPRALCLTSIEIPDDNILELLEENLPANWFFKPMPISAQKFGDRKLMEADWAAIRLPSSVIPEEFNFILNPRANGYDQIKIFSVKDFLFEVLINEQEAN